MRVKNTLQVGSICSSKPSEQGGSMHFTFSTRDTWGHRLRPIRSLNRLVLSFIPTPHVEEHSDQWPQSVVSQKASLLTPANEPTPSSVSSSPLKSTSLMYTYVPISLAKLYKRRELSFSNSIRAYEHSGIEETHISLETNCLLHLNMAAFSGIKYDLVRILNPLPQLTEQLDHVVYSVV